MSWVALAERSSASVHAEVIDAQRLLDFPMEPKLSIWNTSWSVVLDNFVLVSWDR